MSYKLDDEVKLFIVVSFIYLHLPGLSRVRQYAKADAGFFEQSDIMLRAWHGSGIADQLDIPAMLTETDCQIANLPIGSARVQAKEHERSAATHCLSRAAGKGGSISGSERHTTLPPGALLDGLHQGLRPGGPLLKRARHQEAAQKRPVLFDLERYGDGKRSYCLNLFAN